MADQQPEALRLADQLKDRFGATSQAAAKLIRQHAEIERLRAELAALPADVARWLDRRLLPHALSYGWQTRDENGFPAESER